MKIAIIHEMLIKLGGAERVLLELMNLYPEADVFTLMYDEKKVGYVFPKSRIQCTGPAQWFFKLTGKPRASLPLMPASVRKIDLTGYDLVISSSSGFAHGIQVKNLEKMYNVQCRMYNGGSSGKNNSDSAPLIKGKSEGISLGVTESGRISGEGRGDFSNLDSTSRPPLPEKKADLAGMTGPIHICYCHSPARYLWDATAEIQRELGISNEQGIMNNEQGRIVSSVKRIIFGPLVRLLFSWLRRVDLRASKSPDLYIANSREVQGRIQKYYQRDSLVLWPPVDTIRFSPGTVPVSERNYFVVTSALTPFKQIDRVIRVMNRLSTPLKIIGDGAQRAELQKIAGDSVEFLGKISDEAVVEIYKNSRGFLMPQKEDAGIAPLEALAAGIPVFGLAKGGLLEVNIDGVTGRFFSEETDESFEQGFLQFDHEIGEGKYDNADTLRARASEFDAEKFRKGFQDIVRAHLGV